MRVDDLLDPRVDRLLRRHVELDRAEIGAVFGGKVPGVLDRRRVAAGRFAHARIDGVTRTRQRASRQRAEAARRARDHDDLVHPTSFLSV